MARRVLDTNILIEYWHRLRTRPLARCTEQDARGWARRVIALYSSNQIVTPVLLEFVAGFLTRHETRLGRAFLAEFDIADRGGVRKEDWKLARQIAERIPRLARPRQLGDCLIRAVAQRLRMEVVTRETGFPSPGATRGRTC